MSYSLISRTNYTNDNNYNSNVNFDFVDSSISNKLDEIKKDNYSKLQSALINSLIKKYEAFEYLKFLKENAYSSKDFLFPNPVVFASTELIMRSVDDYFFNYYSELNITHYGTIELVFENDKRVMSIEISDEMINYYVESRDDNYHTHEFSTRDINSNSRLLNDALSILNKY